MLPELKPAELVYTFSLRLDTLARHQPVDAVHRNVYTGSAELIIPEAQPLRLRDYLAVAGNDGRAVKDRPS